MANFGRYLRVRKDLARLDLQARAAVGGFLGRLEPKREVDGLGRPRFLGIDAANRHRPIGQPDSQRHVRRAANLRFVAPATGEHLGQIRPLLVKHHIESRLLNAKIAQVRSRQKHAP